ncbi:hypothetical protein K439DRAFT_72484 [Ramaria rubella]|nr:hypothetical protein K439DRAFT_72484 [Ramaria rubella]
MKNSRILAEFREIDSYSDSDDDAPTAADNSLLRMGRSLVAARAGTSTQPNVILRLTRLQTNGEADPRIAQTISTLQDMGLATQFGERAFQPAQPSSPPPTPAPTRCVNLDLSILIALVSDLTHAELPRSEDDAYARFCIPSNARSWRRCAPPKLGHIGGSSSEDSSKHSRALSLQCIQEMHHGLITEIMSRFKSNPHVEFWATAKARARCLQIVDKIGGADEKRRAHALLTAQPSLARDTDASRRVESDFWRNSRYSSPSPPLLPIPIRIHPQHHSPPRMSSLFWVTLIQTCQHILAHEPHRKVESENRSSETATVITAHPKLTVHTMESLLVGACAGMTTLTANRASIRVLLREMEMERMRRGDGEDVACGMGSRDTLDAAVWILEPRSLAEGMRADLQTVK